MKKLIISAIFTAILTAIFFYVKQENETLLWSSGFGTAFIIFMTIGLLIIQFFVDDKKAKLQEEEIKKLKESKSVLRSRLKSQAEIMVNAYEEEAEKRFKDAENYILNFEDPKTKDLIIALKIAAGIKE